MKIRPHILRGSIDSMLRRCELLALDTDEGVSHHSALLVVLAAALDQLASSRRILELSVAAARQAPGSSQAKVRACEELLEELDTFDRDARKRIAAQVELAGGR